MFTVKDLLKDREVNKLTVMEICKKYKINTTKYYNIMESAGHKVKNKGKPKNRQFYRARKTKIWKVRNRLLYGLVLSVPNTMTNTDKEIGVHIRTLESWIYEGVIPKEENQKAVSEYFKYPPEILFYDTNKDRSYKNE